MAVHEDYETLIEPHRAAIRAHCYRMLGSTADADDALQETMLRAWRGLERFEGRSSPRSWLYRVATNVCLRMLERRPRRVLPIDYGPPADPHGPVERVADAPWLEPYPTPDEGYEQRESVELAFIAALQHLPARQRAVLLLRDVLGFEPAEIATALDASPAAVYSALQRAHATMAERGPERSQQATLRALGDDALRGLVERYVAAWENEDVEAIVAMLTEDATFAMPPRPEWYRGRAAIGAFLRRHPLSGGGGWRLVPAPLNHQTAFTVFYPDGRLHGTTLLDLTPEGRIATVTSFHE
jgi:RNA polymerase sigma-70 factor (ECF subfamily)